MRSMLAPCEDTPLLWKEKGGVSLVDPRRDGERKIMRSHQPWLAAPAARALSCGLTTGPGEVALPQKSQGESLEKEWRDHGSASACNSPSTSPQLRSWNSDPALLVTLGRSGLRIPACFFLASFKKWLARKPSAISLLWCLKSCLVHFSETDRVRRKHWTLWNKKQQRPLKARD